MEKIKELINNFFVPFIGELSAILLKIAIIVLVMLIVLEILKAFKILDFINKILYLFIKPLGISKNACTPLVVGLFAGITYGASAILASYANNDMTKKDVILVSCFLCLCHAVIEDTLLFASVGANGWIILLVRFLLAILVTLLVNAFYILYDKKKQKKLQNEEQNL